MEWPFDDVKTHREENRPVTPIGDFYPTTIPRVDNFVLTDRGSGLRRWIRDTLDPYDDLERHFAPIVITEVALHTLVCMSRILSRTVSPIESLQSIPVVMKNNEKVRKIPSVLPHTVSQVIFQYTPVERLSREDDLT